MDIPIIRNKKIHVLLGLVLLSATETQPSQSSWNLTMPQQICAGVTLAALVGAGTYYGWKWHKQRAPKTISTNKNQQIITEANYKYSKADNIEQHAIILTPDHFSSGKLLPHPKDTKPLSLELAVYELHWKKIFNVWELLQKSAEGFDCFSSGYPTHEASIPNSDPGTVVQIKTYLRTNNSAADIPADSSLWHRDTGKNIVALLLNGEANALYNTSGDKLETRRIERSITAGLIQFSSCFYGKKKALHGDQLPIPRTCKIPLEPSSEYESWKK